MNSNYFVKRFKYYLRQKKGVVKFVAEKCLLISSNLIVLRYYSDWLDFFLYFWYNNL